MTKKTLRINPVLGSDESGAPVIFTIPFGGLYYDSNMVTCKQEVKAVSDFQKILTEAEDYHLKTREITSFKKTRK